MISETRLEQAYVDVFPTHSPEYYDKLSPEEKLQSIVLLAVMGRAACEASTETHLALLRLSLDARHRARGDADRLDYSDFDLD